MVNTNNFTKLHLTFNLLRPMIFRKIRGFGTDCHDHANIMFLGLFYREFEVIKIFVEITGCRINHLIPEKGQAYPVEFKLLKHLYVILSRIYTEPASLLKTV